MKPRYADALRDFRWQPLLDALGWTSDGDVNLCQTIVDRHRGSGREALRWFGKNGDARAWTFAGLGDASGRFANLLRVLGGGTLPRCPSIRRTP